MTKILRKETLPACVRELTSDPQAEVNPVKSTHFTQEKTFESN